MAHRKSKITAFTIITLLAPILLLICICTACTSEPQERSVKMLVVHSFKKNLVCYPDMNRMIVEDMRQKGVNPEMQVYYLNCDALGEKEELAAIYQYIDTMKVKPAIILTTDDPATYSLLACRHPFLKKIPIVFTGVNFPNWNLL